MHEDHLVRSRTERPPLNGDLLPALTWTGSAADLHARLELLAASGVTEILYADGTGYPGELRAFADVSA